MENHFVVINLPLPMRMGRVNSYLLVGPTSFVLIDTGSANARHQLVMELKKAGCVPGSLGLVLLTHGDFDHTGSAAYIRAAFGARIAMHKDDIGMVERGDMFYNRKPPNILIRSLIPIFTGFGRFARFTPDILIDDGHDLAKFGYAARVISLPGHSKGSIGVLTPGGDLFCGDFLENTKKPALNSLMDDPAAVEVSLARLKNLEIRNVYPGHGEPFLMDLLRY